MKNRNVIQKTGQSLEFLRINPSKAPETCLLFLSIVYTVYINKFQQIEILTLC